MGAPAVAMLLSSFALLQARADDDRLLQLRSLLGFGLRHRDNVADGFLVGMSPWDDTIGSTLKKVCLSGVGS